MKNVTHNISELAPLQYIIDECEGMDYSEMTEYIAFALEEMDACDLFSVINWYLSAHNILSVLEDELVGSVRRDVLDTADAKANGGFRTLNIV